MLSNRHGTSGTEDLQKHVQVLDGGLGVLAGPISAEAANSLDYELREIVEALSECQLEILADCGRLSSTAQGQIELIKAAHSVLLVSKGDVASLSHA
ncbi:MAG TPA: hypothetical protein VEJ87_13520, partial [Acidimicrobiales bacterium]|nr:hypothetical protein [Acidimicrobiales bacterium]